MSRKIIYFIALTLVLMLTNGAKAQNGIDKLAGAWLGKMQIPDGPKLRIGVEIFRKADGSWGGNVASLDQNHRYILVSGVSFDGHQLTVQLANAPVSIKVKINEDGNNLTGSFYEGSNIFPIELIRSNALPETKRPQTPSEQQPYLTEEVRYKNPHDNTWLSATLTLPKGSNNHPAVLLIAGSGPAHRDAYSAGHRPFKLLADRLTKQGFAVLRADKRGVYKSSGNYESATQSDFSLDAQAAIKFLKGHNQINSNKISLIGHSEGSLIAAMAATEESVTAIVSMAGPGLSILDTILLQDQTEPAAKGATKAETDILLSFSQRFYNAVLTAANKSERKQKLQTIYDSLKGEEAEVVNKWNNRSGTLNVDAASNDSFADMLRRNPTEYWQKISIPVLVLNGGKDAQVPAEQNVSGIIAALNQSNNESYSKKIFPELNHMFQKAQTGSTDEYIQIDETINPEVLKTITNWLQKQNQASIIRESI